MTVFISGGAKSGKSDFAQDLAVQLAQGGVHYYIATMIPFDEEDRIRIRRHQDSRAGLGFETIECGRDLLTYLDTTIQSGTFLVDSITALFMNELFPDPTVPQVDRDASIRCANALSQFAAQVGNAVFVSDSIDTDAGQYDEITELYRRGLAQIDRILAGVCDTVVEMVSGIPILLKGALPK